MKDFLKLIFFGISKGESVELVLPDEDEVVHVKVGFNTVFFLFAGFGGLPLFFKGLWKWGLIMLGLTVYGQYLQLQMMQRLANTFSYADLFNIADNPLETSVNIASLALSVLLGIKGNGWVAQRLFKKGWRFAHPESKQALRACRKWKVSKRYLKIENGMKKTL